MSVNFYIVLVSGSTTDKLLCWFSSWALGISLTTYISNELRVVAVLEMPTYVESPVKLVIKQSMPILTKCQLRDQV